MSSTLQPLVDELIRLEAAPGAAVAISEGGTHRFFAAGRGNITQDSPLTPSSQFSLGCIAKLMTAIVALELTADQRLDLDAPLVRYLPELTGTYAGENVCPRHLLTHTSGYRGPNIADTAVRYFYTWDKLVELLRSDSQIFSPGIHFSYEHTESVLLGEILGRITSTDIQDLHRRLILAPLGIVPSQRPEDVVAEHSFDQAARRFAPLRDTPRCAFWRASLSDSKVSVCDLLHLGEAAAGVDTNRMLRPETVSLLRTPRVSLPSTIGGPLREDTPESFAFGCAHYGGQVFGHNGSSRGQTCALRFCADSDLVTVVLLNLWRPHIRDMLCRKVTGAAKPDDTEQPTANPLNWTFPNLVGLYTGPVGTSAEVRESGHALECVVRATCSPKPLTLTVKRTLNGSLELESDAPQLTLGFSRHNAAEPPLMMLGLNAYCRDG